MPQTHDQWRCSCHETCLPPPSLISSHPPTKRTCATGTHPGHELEGSRAAFGSSHDFQEFRKLDGSVVVLVEFFYDFFHLMFCRFHAHRVQQVFKLRDACIECEYLPVFAPHIPRTRKMRQRESERERGRGREGGGGRESTRERASERASETEGEISERARAQTPYAGRLCGQAKRD
jgi:hypothetical protein